MSLEEWKEYTNCRNRFMRHNGIVIRDITAERVLAELEISADSLNTGGCLHGGAIFTLADAAAGAMARTDGRQYVTECSDIHFLYGVTQGTVTAEATVLRRGKRSCVIHVAVRDDTGALAADVTAHFACVAETLP